MQDIFGNNIGGVNGYETEEERRKRLEREAAERGNTEVGSTLVKNYADGSQEEITKTQIPAPPAGPVAPQSPDTYQRMLQAESGNQQLGPNGQIMTSPKGALGAGQIMPATAMDPGYGVPNIFDMATKQGMPVQARDQATARQLLGNEQLNRQFGQQYFQGMQNRFGGNEDAAVAAYNAGPGRVAQNMQANGGQMNTQLLPTETQGYLKKVLGGALDTVIPSAQAAPAPAPVAATPIDPAAQQQAMQNKQGLNFANANIPAPPAQPPAQGPINPMNLPQNQDPAFTPAAGAMEQAGPTTNLMNEQDWGQRYTTALQDDRQLASIAFDPNLPKGYREMASTDLYKKLDNAKKEAQANAVLAKAKESGDLTEVNRLMKKPTPEGSWMKYLVYGLLGSDAAKIERKRLFPDDPNEGSKVVSFMGMDGKQGLMRIAPDGEPLMGRFADGGALSPTQLIEYAQGVSGKKADYVGGTVTNDKMGISGRVVSRDNRTMVESGGRYYPYTQEWRNNTVGTDLALAAKRAIINMEGKSATESLSLVRKWNVEHPDARISEDVDGIQQLRTYAGGGGMPPAAAPSSGTAATGTGGTTRSTSTGSANPTVEKAKEIGRTDIVKEAAKIVADGSNILSKLDRYETALGQLSRKETNFGELFSEGVIPGEKFVGRKIGSKDYQNTNTIMREIKAIQSVAAKMLGINPTDKDLAFVVANSPTENSTNEEVANYIRTYQRAARRTLDVATKQVESGGRYRPGDENTGDAAPGSNFKKEADGSITLF